MADSQQDNTAGMGKGGASNLDLAPLLLLRAQLVHFALRILRRQLALLDNVLHACQTSCHRLTVSQTCPVTMLQV